MKYVYYISLVLFTLFRKVFGLFWYWVVVWFRGYARNTVYNYILANSIDLKRLNERNPKPFIKYRKVSKLEYYFVVFLIWGWLDDDSGADTFSKGHNNTYINKERYIPEVFRQMLIKANSKASNGSYFDKGDEIIPCFDVLSCLIWNGRNTAYNFSYMFEQISDESLVFYKEVFGLKFGWMEDSPVNGVKYWKLIFGYNF
jgi:hypothetical protein